MQSYSQNSQVPHLRQTSSRVPEGFNKYTQGEILGKGVYGEVYKCTNKVTGQVVAIKKEKYEKYGDEGVTSTCMREISIL